MAVEEQRAARDARGSFLMRRWVVFASIVLGYSCYYLTRNTLTYTAPVMVADPDLGIDITQIGAMTSVFPVAYGVSKFASGVLGARTSPSLLLGGGLMATAAVNVAFGAGAGLAWYCVCWALNGALQGVGGPACARILTAWYDSKERGTYWSMWNIAHNVGGFSAPIVAGGFANAFGWQWGMWVPGLIGLAVGLLVLLTSKDSPQSAGCPPAEPAAVGAKAGATVAAGAAVATGPRDKPDLLRQLVDDVLKTPAIWGLALSYFFVYAVRQGATSWLVFFLINEKGAGDAADAAFRVSGLELGGLFGGLIAGRLSDLLISRGGQGGDVGKRVKVVMAYVMGVALALLAVEHSAADSAALQWLGVFAVGFFLYGPQLIGLCGAELVAMESVGATEGFMGWIAYLGAANAGIPLAFVVKEWGWDAYFNTLLAACGFALLLLWPMTNLKSFAQRQERGRRP